MTPAQVERLRSTVDGSVQGFSLDRAWRSLEKLGFVRSLGPGAQTYTAIYEITGEGRAKIEQLLAARAAS